MKKDNESINSIKEIREKTGLNRKDFCDKYGIPYQTVTDWELGHRNPPDYLIKYMEHFISFHNTSSNTINKSEVTEENIIKIKKMVSDGIIDKDTANKIITELRKQN